MVNTPISNNYNFCRWTLSPFSCVCNRHISCQNTTYIFMDMSVIGKIMVMVFVLTVVLPSLSTILFIRKRLHFSPLFQL